MDYTPQWIKDHLAAAERVRAEIGDDPQKAREFLQRAGILDEDGELAAPYRAEPDEDSPETA